MLKSIVLAASVAAATAFAPMAGVLPKSSREYPPKNPPVACSRNELEGMKGRARSVGSKGWLARRFMGFFAAGMETGTQEHVTAPRFLQSKSSKIWRTHENEAIGSVTGALGLSGRLNRQKESLAVTM
jgi:hypothetical protein